MQAKTLMFITTKDLPDFDLVEGYKAKMIHTNQLSVMHVTVKAGHALPCLLYTSPSPRDATLSRMPSSA